MSGRRGQRRPQVRKIRAALPTAVTRALVVVVGLPPAVVGEVTGWVEAALDKPVRVIPIAASPDDNRPYRRNQIEQVLANVVGYADRKRRAEQQPAPSSILLLYVPGGTDEHVLSSFDFFVFPAPLTPLAQFHEGQQLRHNREEVRRALQAVLVPTGGTMRQFEAVQARVRAVRDAEALQMPPMNFHLGRETPIRELFVRLRRGEVAWDLPIEGLEVQGFDRERLPRLRGGVTKRAYQDARGLVFLRADLLAHHGPNREIEMEEADGAEEDEAGADSAIQHLRGAFRFGAPLGSGFHHDVQLEGGRSLEAINLECARRGPRRSRAAYVNIYPNDILRGKKLAAP